MSAWTGNWQDKSHRSSGDWSHDDKKNIVAADAWPGQNSSSSDWNWSEQQKNSSRSSGDWSGREWGAWQGHSRSSDDKWCHSIDENKSEWQGTNRDGQPAEQPVAAAAGSAIAPFAAVPPIFPAVAAPGRWYDMAFFQMIDGFHDGYKQHNAALKWFRSRQEANMDPFTSQPVVFSNATPAIMGQIIHPPGMEYDFDPTVAVRWSWLEMIAQLDAASMSLVVEGPNGRSRGLTRCSLCVRPNSYDHKRHHARRLAGVPSTVVKLPVWDFVVYRTDGTAIRLHPQWSTTKIESYDLAGHVAPVVEPTAGYGETDGSGTYKLYKDIGNQATLRFDAAKRPQAAVAAKATAKAKGKAAPAPT